MIFSDTNTSQQIASYQLSRLYELLKYLSTHSPYYKKLLNSAKITELDIASLNDLHKIPTTTKDDFARNNSDFLCVPNQQIVDYATTSGTIGKPVIVALTENDLQRLAYNEEQSFLMTGVTQSDVIQLMLTLDRQFMAGMAYYLGARKIGAAVIRSGAVSPAIQWENIQRFNPTVLVAVPSFIVKMIAYAHAHQIDLSATSVKKIVCIGEPIRLPDFSPNEIAARILKHWEVELYSTYASTEMQTAFTECGMNTGNHLRPDLLLVEVLNEQGEQVSNGEAGEVVVTTLGVEGMPVLRYRTGDICTYYNEPCKCGRNTVRLSAVTGRKNQMIKYKGTTLYPPAISNALARVDEVKDFVVEIAKSELGTDEILLHVYSVGDPQVIEQKILSACQTLLRVTPLILFSSPAQLAALRPADSRKPVSIVFR